MNIGHVVVCVTFCWQGALFSGEDGDSVLVTMREQAESSRETWLFPSHIELFFSRDNVSIFVNRDYISEFLYVIKRGFAASELGVDLDEYIESPPQMIVFDTIDSKSFVVIARLLKKISSHQNRIGSSFEELKERILEVFEDAYVAPGIKDNGYEPLFHAIRTMGGDSFEESNGLSANEISKELQRRSNGRLKKQAAKTSKVTLNTLVLEVLAYAFFKLEGSSWGNNKTIGVIFAVVGIAFVLYQLYKGSLLSPREIKRNLHLRRYTREVKNSFAV